jgi:hypothetical protein
MTLEYGGLPRWLHQKMWRGCLLQHGADGNWRDEGGDTPIHCVIPSRIVRDPAEFVRVLIEFGADLGLRNSDGRTALDEALMQTGKNAETHFPIRPIAPEVRSNYRDSSFATYFLNSSAIAPWSTPEETKSQLVDCRQTGGYPETGLWEACQIGTDKSA